MVPTCPRSIADIATQPLFHGNVTTLSHVCLGFPYRVTVQKLPMYCSHHGKLSFGIVAMVCKLGCLQATGEADAEPIEVSDYEVA